jgi:hypothetical protein
LFDGVKKPLQQSLRARARERVSNQGSDFTMAIWIFLAAAAAVHGGATPVDPAQARAQGYAQAQQALTTSTVAATGPVLWRNIQDGMSVAQVHALYPESEDVEWHNDRTVLTDVPIMDGCQAKVNIMHPGGAVKEIVMRGEGADGQGQGARIALRPRGQELHLGS